MEQDYEQIELRNVKVRNIIGRIPPLLIRSGVTFITILLIGLFAAAYFIPYPENIKVPVEATTSRNGTLEVKAYIPYLYIMKVGAGMHLQVEMEGYNARTLGYIKGIIKSMDDKVVTFHNQKCFVVILQLDKFTAIPVKDGMAGNAFVLLSNETIFEHFLNSFETSRK